MTDHDLLLFLMEVTNVRNKKSFFCKGYLIFIWFIKLGFMIKLIFTLNTECLLSSQKIWFKKINSPKISQRNSKNLFNKWISKNNKQKTYRYMIYI